MRKLRNRISSGESTNVLLSEVKRLSPQRRSQMLKNAGITIDIPAQQGLALKTDLGLPWKKMRELRR